MITLDQLFKKERVIHEPSDNSKDVKNVRVFTTETLDLFIHYPNLNKVMKGVTNYISKIDGTDSLIIMPSGLKDKYLVITNHGSKLVTIEKASEMYKSHKSVAIPPYDETIRFLYDNCKGSDILVEKLIPSIRMIHLIETAK